MSINTIKFENGDSLFIEVTDVNLSHKNLENKYIERNDGLADDTEEISVFSEMNSSLNLMKKNLINITSMVEDAFTDNKPNEFSIEVNFGFTGEFSIPYIVSSESNAGIKVKATWKKAK